MGSLILLAAWALAIYVAVQIGQPKHRAGWAYGLLLGWIGVLILALLPARTDPNISALPDGYRRH